MADTEYADKDWGKVIKIHTWRHFFDEIEAKGASRNFNTKPNEKLHGPLKKHYLRRTNFKNVEPQVDHKLCLSQRFIEAQPIL